MMGHREKMKGPYEDEVFSSWRRWIKFYTRAGVTHRFKKWFSRRIRRQAKSDLKRIPK